MRFRYDKNTEELIISDASRIEYHQLDIWLTRHVKGYKYMPAFKMGIWNGKNSYFRDGKVNIGLWRECLNACKEIGVPFIIDNKEEFPINRNLSIEDVKEFCLNFFKGHKVKKDNQWIDFMPYDHQIETAFKILKNRYCLAEVATSGGKSLIISIVIFYTLKKIDPNAKFLLIVPSITLVTQMYDDMLENNFGQKTLSEIRGDKLSELLDNESYYSPCEIKVEEVMSDSPRKYSGNTDANIYIGTYQSLDKWPKKFFEQFHTVICDESHGAKSKSITNILSKTFKHAYSRFGVSGTFPSDDSCEILTIQSVIGPKITEVSASELKDKGIITPMEIKSLIINHQDNEFEERIAQIRKMGMGKEALNFEKNYIHLSEDRLNIIKKIVDKCNNNVLILFHTIEYGQKMFNFLKENCPDKEFYYIDGDVKNKDRESIKKLLEEKSEKVRVLCSSFGTLSTGVSIKNLHYLILSDSFKSEQIIIQSIGRLLRLFSGKDKAVIFDMVDVFSEKNKSMLYKHYIERVSFYKKRNYPFSEKRILINKFK